MEASRYVPCVPCECAGVTRLIDLVYAPSVFWDVVGDARQSVPCCWVCWGDSLNSAGEAIPEQVWFAVYDSDLDSDYFAFDSQPEAHGEAIDLLASGSFDYLAQGSEWVRVYVCSVDASSVPTEYTDGWSLWDYEDSAIRYRKHYLVKGECSAGDIG